VPIGYHGLKFKKRDTSISIIFSLWYGAGATGYHDKKKELKKKEREKLISRF